ncbi:ParA family protein [Ornithinibacillus contaminans]|uniref:ParA family protein n=1 Tax=Ornithinibacillus contaminans TaxID=694055 RepID=UPI00064DAA90|nr:ParA family protein [Ornithinibacillus contaminans]
MAKVVTFGLQKGGVSKSTSAGALAYLLSQDGYKTLVIDMDSQGNVTELLTDQPANNFIGKSVFEAIVYKQPKEYTYKVNENLYVLPSNNYLALFAKWIYTKTLPNNELVKYEGKVFEQLNLMIDEIRNDYDYILIDTPPSLSEQTTNSLYASDYVVVLFEASKFCYSAIPNFMESVEISQQISPNKVEPIGMLRTLNDKRRSDAKFFNEKIAEDYPELVFETVITRKASTGRLPFFGFEDNDELSDALSQYREVYKELLKRIGE